MNPAQILAFRSPQHVLVLMFPYPCDCSVLYLQELARAADNTSRSTVPEVFQGRQRYAGGGLHMHRTALATAPRTVPPEEGGPPHVPGAEKVCRGAFVCTTE